MAGAGMRQRWKGDDGTIFEPDDQHGHAEVYDKRGNHAGGFDAGSGRQVSEAVTTRHREPWASFTGSPATASKVNSSFRNSNVPSDRIAEVRELADVDPHVAESLGAYPLDRSAAQTVKDRFNFSMWIDRCDWFLSRSQSETHTSRHVAPVRAQPSFRSPHSPDGGLIRGPSKCAEDLAGVGFRGRVSEFCSIRWAFLNSMDGGEGRPLPTGMTSRHKGSRDGCSAAVRPPSASAGSARGSPALPRSARRSAPRPCAGCRTRTTATGRSPPSDPRARGRCRWRPRRPPRGA